MESAPTPPTIVVAALAGFFGLLFVLERLLPLRRAVASLAGRLVVNLALSALAYGVAFTVVRPAAEAALGWSSERPFGLLHVVELPFPLRAALGFLLLDLAFYYWHLANHRVLFLWRLHNVHHVDPDLDVSTGFRFHFGEVALSAGFRLVQVSLLGVSVWTFALYEVVFQANTLFHHSNVRLPLRFERLLNRVLVTPRMHGIHHSQVNREANSNYSVVLPWWDRIHRTLRLNVPQSRLTIGIAGYSAPGDNRLWNALVMPFRRQRDYWRRPDGTPAERDEDEIAGEPTRMVE